jgi:hypothetical protein
MTLEQAVQAMAAALQTIKTQIPELQVYPYFNLTPTPPSLDIYPAEPFQQGAGFGVGEKKVSWTVRARVSQADPQAASQLLLRLLDTEDAASVEKALQNTAVVANEGQVSGFRVYPDETAGSLLGCEWQTEMFV